MQSMLYSQDRRLAAAANQGLTRRNFKRHDGVPSRPHGRISNQQSLPSPSPLPLPPDAVCPFITNPRDGGRNPNIQVVNTVNYWDAVSISGSQYLPTSSAPLELSQPSPIVNSAMQANYANYLPPIPPSRSTLAHIPLPDSLYQSSPAYPTVEMGILSAERYDDRTGLAQPTRRPRKIPYGSFGTDQRQQPLEEALSMASTRVEPPSKGKKLVEREQVSGERRRKKQKLVSEDEAEDEASKKSRGRPRLDTKDETAADRRRTQIRMAQRAYRHRKEITISSLERKVQDLRTANERMSNILIGLNDYAVGRGILHREPEFGSQLRTATEQFLTLAQSVQAEETSRDEEGASMDESRNSASEDANPEPGNRPTPSVSRPPVIPEETPQPIQHVWDNQMVREENRSDGSSQTDWRHQDYVPPARPDHQVISQATLDNASFSFDVSENLKMQNYRAEVPDMADHYQTLAIFQEALPLNKTLSQHETTFGRHLQRVALERGWMLISDESSNPKQINEIFGFCLRFETRDEIKARLKRGIESTSKDSLFEWNVPFIHLGGAGTYYPQYEKIGGNVIPKSFTGMSMGPFTPAVARIRETAMFDEFRISLPGFEGEFFDANDVEGYLSGRGIVIPPDSDFVTVDLDLLQLNDLSGPESLSDSNTTIRHFPETPRSPSAGFTELNRQENNLIANDENFDMMEPGATDMFFQETFVDWNYLEHLKIPHPNSFNKADLFSDPVTSTQLLVENDMVYRSGRVVTLSVRVLIEELITKTTCLGRAPGFRPSDVEAALRRALKKAF